MKAFFDTNVLVAAVTTDTNRSQEAIRVLNEVDDGYTAIVNLMELRSVLAKKKAFERDRIERIEDRIARKTTVVFPDASDIVAANTLQQETLLYPRDARSSPLALRGLASLRPRIHHRAVIRFLVALCPDQLSDTAFLDRTLLFDSDLLMSMARSTADGDDVDWFETVESVLADHPVSVGIVFGSRARGESHEHSDIDVAVAFEDRQPGDSGHLDARLGLGADLALALGTDDVDVVDLRSAPPALVRAIFRDGKRVVGTDEAAIQLREKLLDDTTEDRRSQTERFDDALAAIDDHLA